MCDDDPGALVDGVVDGDGGGDGADDEGGIRGGGGERVLVQSGGEELVLGGL